MIVVRQKPLDTIVEAVKDFRSLLITGCGGCTSAIEVGGKRQADALKASIEQHINNSLEIETLIIPRQCDVQVSKSLLDTRVGHFDAILSLACGVGVQTLADIYPNKQLLAGVDTMFLGRHDRQVGKYLEMCRACGDCLLSETGSICPITRCPKSLLNGPCGGQVKGKCEVGGYQKDCAWVLIYDRLKERNRLDLFARLRLPRDCRVSEPPRELNVNDLIQTSGVSTKLKQEFPRERKKEAYSKLMKQLAEGKFVFTGELEPEKITDLNEVLEVAKMLKDHVVAVNVTDNPTAFGYINALAPSYLVQRDAGLESIFQITTRDRNRLALLSDVLAASALGIKNILAISGDHTTVGDTPQAKPVFDLDSATFVYMLRKVVDEGVDLNGNVIENPPKFNIGIGASPNADPLEPEIMKLERKVRLGVDFIQTQCVYSVEQAKRFLSATSHLKTPILLGVAPFKSLAMMDWMIKFVPGIKVPSDLESRLRKAREKSKEVFLEENIEIFSQLVRELRKTTSSSGVHLMAVGFEWIVPQIIERSGIA